ncbi:hypothetical protein [Flagellimonas halotolerans]|uniref:DUF1573 domain-containing protein n=1 Tax=Flagellimonas halotolerans TaxID=3112164 RepID=A0ABU6ITC1_9FLAO|nr:MULTISPECIES: hypothetical protein [unclassified Allomuricauda]MEC3966494.1 hypothetical protein [Muricauda sp. SYSU M86414]MEC4266369.1 hypothetical protein [Muricauda sp. SYSU M84420]
MSKKLLLLFISVFVLSCKSDDNSIDCSLVDCFVGEDIIRLTFLSLENDENLLANGTLDSGTIQILNEQNQTVTFSIEQYPITGMVIVVPVSSEEFGQKSFTINIKDGESSFVSFNTSFRQGECCGPYTSIEGVEANIPYDHTLEKYGALPLSITFYISST